jgi:aminopeptidase YwaD
VITKLDDNVFTDIYSYMSVLAKYKKGDATKVTVLRGKDEKTFDVIFE